MPFIYVGKGVSISTDDMTNEQYAIYLEKSKINKPAAIKYAVAAIKENTVGDKKKGK